MRTVGDRLRSKVGSADRVRVVDDVRTAVLVPADGETQPEGKDQADHAEHGSLQDSDRLSIGVVPSLREPAEHHTHEGRSADHAEDQDSELPAAERKEHVRGS